MPGRAALDIAAAAARLVVEEGLEYGPAKRRAARDLGARSGQLPDNALVEDEVRAYLDLFEADTQPVELVELRRIAADWMERLARFRPHLSGAVWRGTATRRSGIHLDLYCDDTKAAELALIDLRIDYDASSLEGGRGGEPISVLHAYEASRLWREPVPIALTVRDYDDLRGALQRDGRGRSVRGDREALRALEATAA